MTDPIAKLRSAARGLLVLCDRLDELEYQQAAKAQRTAVAGEIVTTAARVMEHVADAWEAETTDERVPGTVAP